jgi:hypothetical protein
VLGLEDPAGGWELVGGPVTALEARNRGGVFPRRPGSRVVVTNARALVHATKQSVDEDAAVTVVP